VTSLFADQFGYSTPYGLGPLNTSTPTIGIRTGNLGNTANTTAGNAASEAASEAGAKAIASSGLSAGSDASSSVGSSATSMAAQQGTLSKLSHMSQAMYGDTPGSQSASVNSGSDVSMPRTSGADATLPSPLWGRPQSSLQSMINRTATSPTSLPAGTRPVSVNGGTSWETPAPAPVDNNPLGGFGHWAAHTFDSARHGASNAGADLRNTFQNQNSFGQPGFETKGPGGLPGTGAQYGMPVASNRGIRTSIDPGVTEPTNVWNPSSAVSEPGTSSVGPGVSSPPALTQNYADTSGDPGSADMWSDFWRTDGSNSAANSASKAASSAAQDAGNVNWAQFFATAGRDAGEDG
jgi:hypothetical protein